jgi:hypothetical protein
MGWLTSETRRRLGGADQRRPWRLRRRGRLYSARMAEPARRRDAVEDPPPIDPQRVDRAYRFHRARRRAREERLRERGLARLRFWVILLSLLILATYLSLVAWREIQRLFGL